jgi:hypothetical protein
MMNQLLFYLAFLLCISAAQGQTNFALSHKIESESDFILTDNLQNLYLISEFSIEMYGPDGTKRFVNSIKNLGHITTVDLNFSLKPMVFFGDMNAIAILDNTLSIQGNPVKLSAYNLNWASVAAKSADNHYWFFDTQTFELIRTDMSFKQVRSSGNISQMLGFDIRPDYITEHNNWVYLNNPETGILVFDIYGTYFKQIPIKNLNRFQVTDHFILYLKDETLYQYNLLTFDTQALSIPAKTAKSVRLTKDFLFISDGKSVSVYRFN